MIIYFDLLLLLLLEQKLTDLDQFLVMYISLFTIMKVILNLVDSLHESLDLKFLTYIEQAWRHSLNTLGGMKQIFRALVSISLIGTERESMLYIRKKAISVIFFAQRCFCHKRYVLV